MTQFPSDNCPEPSLLIEFLQGKLEPPVFADCQAHLEQCAQCHETLRGLDSDDTLSEKVAAAMLSATSEQDSDSLEIEEVIARLRTTQFQTRSPIAAHLANSEIMADRAAEVLRCLEPDNETLGLLGDYALLRLIGSGSSGVVFQALDRKLHRTVAVKVLRPSLGVVARDRFLLEARSTGSIEHANVVTIFEVGQVDRLAFIAMQWLPGETLEAKLQSGVRLDESQITDTVCKVASGLAAAHQKQLVHRDIKPANLWICDADQQIKILDFGLVRINDDNPGLTATGMLAGTPNFMSPEQTRGEELDGRSDLFSLGCLMYQLLTGRLPFGASTILGTLHSVQNESPIPPKHIKPDLPQHLSDLTMCLLEKQPANRPDSASQLIEMLSSPRESWPILVNQYHGSPEEDVDVTRVRNENTARQSSGVRWLIAGLLLGLVGWGAWFWSPQIIRVMTDQGEVVIESKVDDVEIQVFSDGKLIRVVDMHTQQSFDLKSGDYTFAARSSDDAKNTFAISPNQLTMSRGSTQILTIATAENTDKRTGERKNDPLPSEKKPTEVSSSEAIDWVDNFDKARELSNKTGRPLLLYVYAAPANSGNPLFASVYHHLRDPLVVKQFKKFVCYKENYIVSKVSKNQFYIKSAPLFLVLGTNNENVFRFHDPLSPASVIKNLGIALDRYKLFQSGREWVPPISPIADWDKERLLEEFPAPMEGGIRGIAASENEILFAQSRSYFGSESVYKLDPVTGEPIFKWRLRGSTYDICADKKFVYSVDVYWSTGRGSICVYDKVSGKQIRNLKLDPEESNPMADTYGIACYGKKLYVLYNQGKVATVDSESGKIEETIKLEGRSGHGLDFDGKNFLSGTDQAIVVYNLDGSIKETITSPHKLSSVAFQKNAVLAAYYPEWGRDKKHERIRLRPKTVELYKLRRTVSANTAVKEKPLKSIRAGSPLPTDDPQIFKNRTFAQWLGIARRDRDAVTASSALKACAETAETAEEIDSLIALTRELCRKYGSNVLGVNSDKDLYYAAMVQALNSLDANQICKFIATEIAEGNEASRSFCSGWFTSLCEEIIAGGGVSVDGELKAEQLLANVFLGLHRLVPHLEFSYPIEALLQQLQMIRDVAKEAGVEPAEAKEVVDVTLEQLLTDFDGMIKKASRDSDGAWDRNTGKLLKEIGIEATSKPQVEKAPQAAKAPLAVKPNIEWMDSLKEAQHLSKKDGRPVLVYGSSNGELPIKPSSKYYKCLNDPLVIEKLRNFICVKGNLGGTSAIYKNFNIIGWPTVFVLGNNDENIYRFQHVSSPSGFVRRLEIAMEKYSRYRAGKDWNPNREEADLKPWEDGRLITKFPAPWTGKIYGVASADNEILLIQNKMFGEHNFLFALDGQNGEILSKSPMPKDSFVVDICADEQFIYGVTFGWTAGKPIYIFEKSSKKLVRELVTMSNKENRGHSTGGIACHDGKLYVLRWSGKVAVVDPDTGEVLDELKLEACSGRGGLDFNGEYFVSGSYNGFKVFDSQGKAQETIKSPREIAGAAFRGEALLGVFDQTYGFDKDHNRIRTSPEKLEIYEINR